MGVEQGIKRKILMPFVNRKENTIMLKKIKKLKPYIKDFFKEFFVFMIYVCIVVVIAACLKAGFVMTLAFLRDCFCIYLISILILFCINKIREKFFK